MPQVGRNHACPCGSGKKAKKCHEVVIGMAEDIATWFIETQDIIHRTAGYVAPMSDEERREWKQTGCPFGVCVHDTIGEPGEHCAAPNCGV